jgi:hypothetical protein
LFRWAQLPRGPGSRVERRAHRWGSAGRRCSTVGYAKFECENGQARRGKRGQFLQTENARPGCGPRQAGLYKRQSHRCRWLLNWWRWSESRANPSPLKSLYQGDLQGSFAKVGPCTGASQPLKARAWRGSGGVSTPLVRQTEQGIPKHLTGIQKSVGEAIKALRRPGMAPGWSGADRPPERRR